MQLTHGGEAGNVDHLLKRDVPPPPQQNTNKQKNPRSKYFLSLLHPLLCIEVACFKSLSQTKVLDIY